MQIKDFINNSNINNVPLLLKKINERQTKNGKPYVNLTFIDKSGEISTNVWDMTQDQFQGRVNTVYGVKGKVGSYMGTPQLENITLSTLADNDPNNDPELYESTAPEPRRNLVAELQGFIGKIHNDRFRDLVNDILSNNQALYHESEFSLHPAASKMHHEFRSGLIFHTVRMLRDAEKLSQVYPILNADLLFTAIILHDTGKMVELEDDGNGVYGYSTEGSMLGHISIVDGWITYHMSQMGYDVNDEQFVVLRHVVLAHHGRLEYGSPVTGLTPEAYIINYIDMMDADMTKFEKVYKDTDSGNMSNERIFALDRKRVFHTPEEL